VERPCRRNRTFYKIIDRIKMRVIIWIFRFTLKERNSQDEPESLELWNGILLFAHITTAKCKRTTLYNAV